MKSSTPLLTLLGAFALMLPFGLAVASYFPPCLPGDVYEEDPPGKAHCLERREFKLKQAVKAREQEGVGATERVFTPTTRRTMKVEVRKFYANPTVYRSLHSGESVNERNIKLRKFPVKLHQIDAVEAPSPTRQDLSERSKISHRVKRMQEKEKRHGKTQEVEEVTP